MCPFIFVNTLEKDQLPSKEEFKEWQDLSEDLTWILVSNPFSSDMLFSSHQGRECIYLQFFLFKISVSL